MRLGNELEFLWLPVIFLMFQHQAKDPEIIFQLFLRFNLVICLFIA